MIKKFTVFSLTGISDVYYRKGFRVFFKGFKIDRVLFDTKIRFKRVYLKGSIPEAMALVKDLRENHGIFCSIVVYPVIPKGLILLRLIPTASHTLEDVEETLDAFSAIRERLENGTYKRLSAGVSASMEA